MKTIDILYHIDDSKKKRWVDEMGVVEVGVDEMGSRQSGTTPTATPIYSWTCCISHLYKSSTYIREPFWNIPRDFHYIMTLHKTANSITQPPASRIIPKMLIALYKTATS